jgi:DUF971 family protein
MEVPRPLEIGRANAHDIQIRWSDGAVHTYPARRLRLKCPCALCVDEVTGAVRVNDAHLPQNVIPLQVAVNGHYAMSVTWSDGHNTGIYPFRFLRALGEQWRAK